MTHFIHDSFDSVCEWCVSRLRCICIHVFKTRVCSYIWIHLHTYEYISIHMYEHTLVDTMLIWYMTHLIVYVNAPCLASDARVTSGVVLREESRTARVFTPLVRIYSYVFICMYSYVWIHVCIHMYVFICMYSYVCIHMYVFICMYSSVWTSLVFVPLVRINPVLFWPLHKVCPCWTHLLNL